MPRWCARRGTTRSAERGPSARRPAAARSTKAVVAVNTTAWPAVAAITNSPSRQRPRARRRTSATTSIVAMTTGVSPMVRHARVRVSPSSVRPRSRLVADLVLVAERPSVVDDPGDQQPEPHEQRDEHEPAQDQLAEHPPECPGPGQRAGSTRGGAVVGARRRGPGAQRPWRPRSRARQPIRRRHR